jgi:tRNA G18 (ribose-2'-O)-methylase SpoU
VIEPVADPDDPRLEPYRSVRERDLVGRSGLFIAEGRVVLEKLVAAGLHPVRSVLVAEKRLDALAGVLAGLQEEVPVYAAGQAVMDAVVGFPIHRGILAVGERAEASAAGLLAGVPDKALVVALSAIANHDNMGGIFRNAAAFGAAAVLLDADCCDPLYRKAIRVSVGAALTVPFAKLPPGADLIATLEAAGFEVLALSPRGAIELDEVEPTSRTALLLVAEGPGLSDAALARAKGVRIAMAGGFDSLNVATASGVALHRIALSLRSGPGR